MAKDRIAELKAAITAAEASGWMYIGNNTVRRMAEHQTPQFAKDNGWYPGETYSSLEFLSFVLHGPNKVPTCIYETSRAAWVATQECEVTWKRALELLAQPVEQSDVHTD